jgi:hypothetical protein
MKRSKDYKEASLIMIRLSNVRLDHHCYAPDEILTDADRTIGSELRGRVNTEKGDVTVMDD